MDYGIDMTLADIANAHTDEVLKRQEERRVADMERKKAETRKWMVLRVLFCLPCAAFAFWHCPVFLKHGGAIFEAAMVLACVAVTASTLSDYNGMGEEE